MARPLRLLPGPRVLTHLEAWIRRRLRSYLWRRGRTGTIASTNCAVVARQSFNAAVAAGSRPASGACTDIRRSNRPCATTTSTRSVPPLHVSVPAQPGRTAVVRDPYDRWCWEGDIARCSPIPIKVSYFKCHRRQQIRASEGSPSAIPTAATIAAGRW